MNTKLLILIVFFVSLVGTAQNLEEVRSQYPLAKEDIEITQNLHQNLLELRDTDPVLSAYKGAVLTIMAKFEKKAGEKLRLFKEGRKLMEDAIEADATNIEIRMIRLGVQENAPKILGYNKNMEEDKEFILRNYEATSSQVQKQVVKKFVLQSEIFSAEERAVFK